MCKTKKVTEKQDKNNALDAWEQRAKDMCSVVTKLNPNKPLFRGSQAASPRLSVTTNIS